MGSVPQAPWAWADFLNRDQTTDQDAGVEARADLLQRQALRFVDVHAPERCFEWSVEVDFAGGEWGDDVWIPGIAAHLENFLEF